MAKQLRALADESKVRFGTSGVRGLVADMSDEVCYAYAKAFLGAVAANCRSVVVGHDLRPSSPRIAAACVQAIRDSGCEPLFVGALPTPALAYFCSLRASPGIIVTGSHIPFDRNGIKFYRADGEIDKADEAAMMDAAVNVPSPLSPAALPPADAEALRAYSERYVGFFGEGRLAGMRVALYEHSSVARDVLRAILVRLGAEVIALGRTDTFVPIDTEAVRQEDVAQARAWAQQHRFDAILSTDGDADRPLIGDEAGAWLRGDVVGILCAQYLQARVVVTPVSSNSAVEKCGAFERVIRTKIGSPYVIEGMQRLQALGGVVGYEANGGFLLGSDIARGSAVLKALPTRDAVLPMLCLLVMAREKGCRLSQLAQALPSRFTASDRIQDVPTDWSCALIATLAKNLPQAAGLMAPDAGQIVALDMTDGLRASFATGDIVHLRPSGNAPELRCYAEADEEARARALCDACLANVRSMFARRG